jgi:hypothetical protein
MKHLMGIRKEKFGGSAIGGPPKKENIEGGMLSPRPYDREIISEIERLKKEGASEDEILRQINSRSRGDKKRHDRKIRQQRSSETENRKES